MRDRCTSLCLVPVLLLGGGACEGSGGSSADAGPDAPADAAAAGPPAFDVLFDTGYEADEAVGCEGDESDPVCGEASTAHDVLLFFEPQPDPDWRTWDLTRPEASMAVFYETDAPASARFARIVDDPTRAGNRVLHFRITDAVIPSYRDHTKGRVQTNTGFDPPVTELYYRQRVYLHPDLELLLDYPAPDDWWLGIVVQEMRAGSPPMGAEHSFSMDLSVVPDFEREELHLQTVGKRRAAGEPGWTEVWGAIDEDNALPLGQWLTVDVGYRQGDGDAGRFVTVVWREGEPEPLIVLDVNDWTYHPDAPSPVGLSSWGGPQKVYSSDNVIHHVRDAGGRTQIYFDDFAIAEAWPPGWTPPASTVTRAR